MVFWPILRKLFNESYDLYVNDFENKYHSMFATINIPKNVYENDKNQKKFQFYLSSGAQRKLREITCGLPLQRFSTVLPYLPWTLISKVLPVWC